MHVQRYTVAAAFRYPLNAPRDTFEYSTEDGPDPGAETTGGRGAMAAAKLDGAGAQKMKTIEEALVALQAIHGMVERMAIELRRQGSVGMLPNQIKRNAVMLQGQLKGQFGLIADQVSAMVLAIGRGGGEALRLRMLRESVAQIRTALEIAANKVKERHAVSIESPND
jgi:hypothetical protein